MTEAERLQCRQLVTRIRQRQAAARQKQNREDRMVIDLVRRHRQEGSGESCKTSADGA